MKNHIIKIFVFWVLITPYVQIDSSQPLSKDNSKRLFDDVMYLDLDKIVSILYNEKTGIMALNMGIGAFGLVEKKDIDTVNNYLKLRGIKNE